MPSLLSFLDAAMPTMAGDDAAPGEERQADAADGKVMPDAPATSPFAWLATLAPPMVSPPPPVAAPAPAPAGGVALAAPVLQPAAPATPPQAGETAPPTLPAAQPGTDVATAAPSGLLAFARDPALANASGPVTIELPAEPRADSAIRPDAPVPATVPLAAVLPGTTAPAGQVFAAALHASTRGDDMITDQRGRSHDPELLPALAATGVDLAAQAVTGAGDTAGGGALDMREQRWPQAMVDRIERMRDDADAADTRIRLHPDALGSIDVALRRDGDTLHVRFHAAQAETRGLLADAQPRLAQLAAERGMTLGDAQVGGGAGGSGRQDRTPGQPAPAPRPAPAAVATAPEPLSDHRIA